MKTLKVLWYIQMVVTALLACMLSSMWGFTGSGFVFVSLTVFSSIYVVAFYMAEKMKAEGGYVP